MGAAKVYLVQAHAIFMEFNDEHNTAVTIGTLASLWQESGGEG